MSLLHTLAVELAQAGSTVESKIYDTLQWQVRVRCGEEIAERAFSWAASVTLLCHLLSRSGPSCQGSVQGPQMWLPPSKVWHGHWAQPLVSART